MLIGLNTFPLGILYRELCSVCSEIPTDFTCSAPIYPSLQDSLSKIAKRILGNGNRWPEIYAQNKGVIGSNPDLIYPGQKYRIRTS